MVKFKLSGLGKLQAQIDKLNPAVERAAKAGVGKAAAKIEGDAKMMSPVDTGALRGSIHTNHQGLKATVGTGLAYAPHVEFGTSKSKAQPFMKPALNTNRQTAQKIVSSEISRAIRQTK